MAVIGAENRCAYPWQQMIIDLTGEVVPCCYWSGYGNTGKPLGNTNISSIDDIWNGEGYRALRSTLASGDLTDHPCGNCMSYRWSGGRFPEFTRPTRFAHESGHCYLGRVQESFLAVIRDDPAGVELRENGVALPIRDAPHDDIRHLGAGRYSVWNGWLYFSATDNSNPLENGRGYELISGDRVVRLINLAGDATSSENSRLAHAEFVAGAERQQAKPSMISYISTADCNIDCPACSQNIVRYAKIQHRPDTTSAILDLVPYLTSFVWHGGEPYLIKKFRKFIDEFETEHNPNLVFGFTSNGQQITAAEAEKLLKFPQLNASVSIDSFNAETFSRIRAGGDFKRILDNLHRLIGLYDAPQRVFSVGMIICKSNMAELAENLAYAIEHDIGINLSPVLVYPVNEQLNVFEDFPAQSAGWETAIERAAALVEDAKSQRRLAVERIDPTGMVAELRAIYQRALEDHSEIVELRCEVSDEHESIGRMRRPAIIAYSDQQAVAYAELRPGTGYYVLKFPSRRTSGHLRIDVVHSVFEPHGTLLSEDIPDGRLDRIALIRLPTFQGAPRLRNILLANYGESSPDGAHVRDAREVNEAYHRLHAQEEKNQASVEFVEKNEELESGFGWDARVRDSSTARRVVAAVTRLLHKP